MAGRMDFDLKFGSSSARPREPEARLELLIVGDWSGDSELRPKIEARKPRRVDVDRFDALCRELRPALALGASDSPHRLTFEELDDFHPDRIFERLELFRSLRELRAKLVDPKTFAEAARAIRGDTPEPAAPTNPSTAPAAPDASRSDFERLLGSSTPTTSTSGTSNPDVAGSPGVEGFLRGLMAPHVTAAPDPNQPLFVAAADQAVADAMRVVLHAPQFQRLEAAWLGLSRLVRSLESEDIGIWIYDVTEEELRTAIADPAGGAIHRALVAPQSVPGAPRWSVWAVDAAFGEDTADLATLAFLGALGASIGVPVVAAASPALVGIDSFALEPDTARWTGPSDALKETWTELRRSPVATWIALAAPRLLLRLPYGAKTNPTERFRFEEMPVRSHSEYLWGHAVWGILEVIARKFAESGWDMDRPDGADIEDLPIHVYLDGGEKQAQATAEAFLPERAIDPLLAQGISPILSIHGRNAARLVRLRSISVGSAPLAGPWD